MSLSQLPAWAQKYHIALDIIRAVATQEGDVSNKVSADLYQGTLRLKTDPNDRFYTKILIPFLSGFRATHPESFDLAQLVSADPEVEKANLLRQARLFDPMGAGGIRVEMRIGGTLYAARDG